jgi:hypothetical protein
MTDEIRWCDQGCGYKLLSEYADNETTCGACLDVLEAVVQTANQEGDK